VVSIDVATLYAIADSVTALEQSYFDYIFSDEKPSLGERIRTFCKCCLLEFCNMKTSPING